MKIQAAAFTQTNIGPTTDKFFYITTDPTIPGTTLTIPAAAFFQDDGSAATALPALTSGNSYFNVYINGVLQMEGNAAYTPGATGVGSLAFSVPEGGERILPGTSVILEVVNFAPASTTVIET